MARARAGWGSLCKKKEARVALQELYFSEAEAETIFEEMDDTNPDFQDEAWRRTRAAEVPLAKRGPNVSSRVNAMYLKPRIRGFGTTVPSIS